MIYKVRHGFHSRRTGTDKDGKPLNTIFGPGDFMDLTRAEAEKLGPAVAPHIPHVDSPAPSSPTPDPATVGGGEGGGPAGAGGGEGAGPQGEEVGEWDGVDKLTVEEVKSLVESIEDPAELRSIFAAEQSQSKPRVGVLNAVRRRLADLQDSAAATAADSESGGAED